MRQLLRLVRLANSTGRHQRGFTLVEMLASLAIAAVAFVLIGSNVRLLASSWDRHTERLQQSDQLIRGGRVLQRDLQAIRRVREGEPDSRTLSFAGNRRSVSFVTLEPEYPVRPGLAFVSYGLREGTSGFQLIRRRARFTEGASITAVDFKDPVVIFDDISDLQFGYLSETPDSAGWMARWSDPETLPALVRIRTVKTTGPGIPDVVVRLRSDAEQECTRDDGPPCTIDSRLRGAEADKPEGSR
ncbi:MAG: PulJ/GspJ family protein [Hyphomicrobiaceae bacterium]